MPRCVSRWLPSGKTSGRTLATFLILYSASATRPRNGVTSFPRPPSNLQQCHQLLANAVCACICVCVSTLTHTEPSARIHAADRIRSVAMVASRSSLGVKALPVAFRGLLSFLSLLLRSLMFTLLVHSASLQSHTRCSSSK